MSHYRYFNRKFTFVFPAGVSGDALTQTQRFHAEAELMYALVRTSSNTNAVSAQVKVIDEDNFKRFDSGTRAHNTEYMTGFSDRRVLGHQNIVTCTISGDPGASGFTITFVMSCYGRDFG